LQTPGAVALAWLPSARERRRERHAPPHRQIKNPDRHDSPKLLLQASPLGYTRILVAEGMQEMTIPAAAGRYDPVARAVHWLVAAFAVIVVALGWASVSAPHNTPARDSLLLLHRSAGVIIFALMLMRLLWRWRRSPPPLPPALGRLESGLAHLTHLGLFLIFIIMPLAGYVNAAAAGHAVSLFGLAAIPPFLPINQRLSQIAITIHLVGQYLVYLLVSLHVLGALYHGIFKRDGVLERMLPRRRHST
jgi:cytochrome b561